MIHFVRLLFCLFVCVSTLASAPVGNPSSPALVKSGIFSPCNPWIAFSTGYLADYVSDMKLSLSSGSLEFDPHPTFDKFQLHSQMASVSLILLQRLEAYALLGGTKEKLALETDPKTPLYSDLFDFQSSYHFSWAAGMKIVLLEWGRTYFSIDGNYFAVPSSHKSFFKFLNRLNLPLETEKQTFYLREWQMGASLASSFWIFTPYVGMKYLHAKLRIQEGQLNSPLIYRNERSIGYYYGLTLNLTSKFQITGERRMRDEFAYMFSTQAIF